MSRSRVPPRLDRTLAAAVIAVLASSSGGCRRASSEGARAQAPASEAAAPAPAAAATVAKLPEDPVAGRKSELQWRQHMDAEERERQLGYDRRRMKQHQAIVRWIRGARARYDRARTDKQVTHAQEAVTASMPKLRERITAIDHWGVNSPLLPDYDALLAALAAPYPDAKRAALASDGEALRARQDDADQRLSKIKSWLRDAAESEDE